MLAKLLIAWGLMALSVAIHAAGVSAVLRRRVNAVRQLLLRCPATRVAPCSKPCSTHRSA